MHSLHSLSNSALEKGEPVQHDLIRSAAATNMDLNTASASQLIADLHNTANMVITTELNILSRVNTSH